MNYILQDVAKPINANKNNKNQLQYTHKLIPSDVLDKCKGIAVLTVIKGGFIWSGRLGTGLVIAKLPDGSWSAPSAIGTLGIGFGGQIGGELTDFVMILNNENAVKAFSRGGNFTLGTNLSIAAGPTGRSVEVGGSIREAAAVYSYSKTKGLFAGVSIEGTLILEREDANQNFYKYTISSKELLLGKVLKPQQAQKLYDAIEKRSSNSKNYVLKSETPPDPQDNLKPNKESNLDLIYNSQNTKPDNQNSQNYDQKYPYYNENQQFYPSYNQKNLSDSKSQQQMQNVERVISYKNNEKYIQNNYDQKNLADSKSQQQMQNIERVPSYVNNGENMSNNYDQKYLSDSKSQHQIQDNERVPSYKNNEKYIQNNYDQKNLSDSKSQQQMQDDELVPLYENNENYKAGNCDFNENNKEKHQKNDKNPPL
ncbi:hypothetical protein BB561_000986 [Smittium simulii]|uniref:Ysc84 actin-binding domain-containing protein n=1 Tax=Smittium simulii TaxID=133385 RepID=A0A2T9YWQ1_9FUNG|nr:hypothetical protein BB561_000986 [Smittium simulii]